MPVSLSFLGAAEVVTGSKFLIDAGGTRILVDCGLFQGEKHLRLKNWEPLPIDPQSIDAVVLTHAHIDHSGYLPRLVKDGFRGRVYSTDATSDLAEILLPDSARIQEEDAAYANRKGFSKHNPALPLYTEQEAFNALRRFRSLAFNRWQTIGNVRFQFRNAGHILGSAHVELEATDGRTSRRIDFSGDVGRYHVPVHSDPSPPPRVDTMVMESTYGDREHDHAPLQDQLLDAIQPTLRRGGTVLIPSFAVARAQLIVWLLAELIGSGRLGPVPIHVDSPMAADVSELYIRHAGDEGLDADVLSKKAGLASRYVRYHRSVDESKALNQAEGPRIIVSSSGMLTGGRVLHHLEHLAGDRKNAIVLAGYQAWGTRGRQLIEGQTRLRIHGRDVDIRAEVRSLEGFSAHADLGELIHWLGEAPERPDTIFLVHGELESADAMRRTLGHKGYHAIVPRLGERFTAVATSKAWRSDSAPTRKPDR